MKYIDQTFIWETDKTICIFSDQIQPLGAAGPLRPLLPGPFGGISRPVSCCQDNFFENQKMKLAVRAILEIWKWKLSSGFYFQFPAVAVLVDNDQPVVGRKDENQDDQDKDKDNHNEEEYDDAKDKDSCGSW